MPSYHRRWRIPTKVAPANDMHPTCGTMDGRLQSAMETNLQKGVCGVAFDRQDIAMNKFSAACLESHCHFFDARTQHSKTGDIPRMPNCLYARHTLCVLLMAVT